MKRKVLILALIAIVISCSLYSKTITGTVTSAEDGSLLPGVTVIVKDTKIGTTTNLDGKYTIEANDDDILVFNYVGMKQEEVQVNGQNIIDVVMESDITDLDEVVVVGYGRNRIGIRSLTGAVSGLMTKRRCPSKKEMKCVSYDSYFQAPEHNTEGYAAIHENGYKKAIKTPLSTFSIDVDAASYSNMRRFLNNGQKPPIDAVRIEEMINYFTYDYSQPDNGHPFSINHELSACPWNKDNLLLHIGLQGEKVATENLPPSNIVFLIDVSGSMDSPNKLGLLKKSFKLLVQQLRDEDRVAMVVYAGSSGLVLPSTSGAKKQKILEALNRLNAGGSTAGAAGLKLAYKIASENFIKEGNNRIILATDGDFNVGQSSNAEMERLIEKEREKGIFISVLGFGMGNYKDDKMEIIADKGNGNYAYIDNIMEAKKVLVNEFGGTLFTIAKDVKIQIEFNPAVVKSYRLIGYENRLLNDEDFEDDKKDAGELGSGHTVTALYEIKLAKGESEQKNILKYQTANLNSKATIRDEVATVKFRYKKPDGQKSILLEKAVSNLKTIGKEVSDNFKFSAAVAGFGMLLRDSEFKGECSYKMLIDMAQNAKGVDKEGYRSEFIQLIKLAEHL